MRDALPGYYPPSTDDLNGFWEDALVVLDASALLNLFQYSLATTGQILRVLDVKTDQLWIPYQVGLEFQRRKDGVIRTQLQAFEKIEAAVDDSYRTTETAINEFKKHPSLGSEELLTALEKNRKRLKKILRRARTTR